MRIDEWDWDEAPGRAPIMTGDLPRQDRPLPKALDDPAAARFLRAAQAEPRHLTRVVCEVLLRTGLRSASSPLSPRTPSRSSGSVTGCTSR
ncbi:hypothetical protein [Actinocrispum sp. NPDC049592]|uniref:hypothetical protein n=1 Tax=Actinocrispum sp. NPDC049592 TaxID=3154835 RepID=UPI003446437F